MPDAATLLNDALTLPAEQRALLAEKLLESLDLGDDFEVSDAWREEIRKRLEAYERGEVAGIPLEDALRNAATVVSRVRT